MKLKLVFLLQSVLLFEHSDENIFLFCEIFVECVSTHACILVVFIAVVMTEFPLVRM